MSLLLGVPRAVLLAIVMSLNDPESVHHLATASRELFDQLCADPYVLALWLHRYFAKRSMWYGLKDGIKDAAERLLKCALAAGDAERASLILRRVPDCYRESVEAYVFSPIVLRRLAVAAINRGHLLPPPFCEKPLPADDVLCAAAAASVPNATLLAYLLAAAKATAADEGAFHHVVVSALQAATRPGNVELFRLLLAASGVALRRPELETLLLKAACHGAASIVRLLLRQKGLRGDCRDGAVLRGAAYHARAEVVGILLGLRRGAPRVDHQVFVCAIEGGRRTTSYDALRILLKRQPVADARGGAPWPLYAYLRPCEKRLCGVRFGTCCSSSGREEWEWQWAIDIEAP